MTLPSDHVIRPFRTIDGLSIRYAESEPEPITPSCSGPGRRACTATADVVAAGRARHWWRSTCRCGTRSAVPLDVRRGRFIIRVADEFGLENPHVVGPTSAPTPRCSPPPAIPAGCAACRRERRRGGPDPARRGAEGLGRGPRLRALPKRRPPQDRRGRAGDHRAVQDPGRHLRGLPPAYEGDRFFESMRYVRTYPAQLPVLRDLLPGMRPRCRTSPAATTGRPPPIRGVPPPATAHRSSTSSTRPLHLGRQPQVRRADHGMP